MDTARQRIATILESDGVVLDLSFLDLDGLPNELFEAAVVAKLQFLNLSFNRLATLPDRLFDLTALQSLSLNYNGLTVLPDRLFDLTALQWLNLRGNQLTALPDRLFDLTALQSLDLSINGLTALPDRIGDLTALQSLKLHGNRLTALPDRLFDLTALQSLYLGGNRLTALPDRLFDMTALQSLDLGDSGLTALPDRIGDLIELQWLDLPGNRLTVLPKSIFDLAPDIRINLFDNPLREPPLKIGEGGIKAIRQYFDLKESDPARYVRRSSLSSLDLGRRSRLAIGETAVMTLISVILIYLGHYQLLWTGAALAPLLLLRTKDSTDDGVTRFRWLVRALRLRRSGPVLILPFKLIALGIGSISIKFGTMIQHFFKFGWMQTMPENYRRQLVIIDSFSPSELVPGAEDAYGVHKREVLTVSDLLTDFNKDPSDKLFTMAEFLRKNPLVSMIGILFSGVFFFFAWAYRFTLKATCLIYWPFLLIHRDTGDTDLRRRLMKSDALSIRKKTPVAVFMLLVGAFGLVNLLALAGSSDLGALVGGLAPEGYREILARFPPALEIKLLYTGCFALALFYLLAKLFEFMISVRPIDRDEVWDRGDTNAIRWLARVCYVGQNLSICLVTAFVFIWAIPQAPGLAAGAWGFFF